MESESETEPFLQPDSPDIEDLPSQALAERTDIGNRSISDGRLEDGAPDTKQRIGMTSAVFLITTRMIGTGIFATPSIILSAVGSVGFALIMWILGAVVAATGAAVYMELGSALPRSGGEKVYLEYIYSRPKYLISCLFASWTLGMVSAGGASMVFSDYLLRAFGIEPTPSMRRSTAVLCVTLSTAIHSVRTNIGLRFQNLFGICGLVSLLSIAITGILVFCNLIKLADGRASPHSLLKPWEGTSMDVNSFVTGLFAVIWSYKGYSNANYALSETKDPVRSLKRAVPVAVIIVGTTYILVNISYFAVIEKEDILGGGQLAVALFFRNVAGRNAEAIASALVAANAFGNILSILFVQSRIVQELGRESVIPFSRMFSSSEPFGTPFAALVEQWVVALLVILLPPPGDAYALVVNLTVYPFNLANLLIAVGLLWLHWTTIGRDSLKSRSKGTERPQWSPPFRAWTAAIAVFAFANVFLLLAPFIPPHRGQEPYQNLPYWIHAVSVPILSTIGFFYWFLYVSRRQKE